VRDSRVMDGDFATVAPGVFAIDTVMAGELELNAVYVLDGAEPCLVETGPGADHDRLTSALDALGVGPDDLAHIVVTHIHMDHAGGAGALLLRYPNATVWVHEAGARHLVDPDRLIASTARTYGSERMRALYGDMLPVPQERVRAVADGDVIPLGTRSLHVLHTPGHASHHIALHDDTSGAMFTGEAIGSYLPWASCFRPALPPPEVDVEAALTSIERIAERGPTTLLTSHFGPVPDVEDACGRAADRIRDWAQEVRAVLEMDVTAQEQAVVEALSRRARREFEADAGRAFEPARYDALGSIRMNAQGLARYWRRRWEREAGEA
jgi:glyoxylase-like metal-dependent hydrolase (beta-lactamase superfamily II)